MIIRMKLQNEIGTLNVLLAAMDTEIEQIRVDEYNVEQVCNVIYLLELAKEQLTKLKTHASEIN